jgi:hypothetical protein
MENASAEQAAAASLSSIRGKELSADDVCQVWSASVCCVHLANGENNLCTRPWGHPGAHASIYMDDQGRKWDTKD